MKATAQYLCLIALCLLSWNAQAQLAAEKVHDISKKSKRGYLGNVITDDARKQVDLVFVTKSNNRKVKFDVYQFDYDLNLINEFSDEQEVEKAKSKYKWFNFRGKDVESITGVTAQADMLGKVVFKRKEITFRYNWFTGNYKKDTKVLGRLKPKNEDGQKYFFNAAFDLDESGEVMALAGVKKKGIKNFENPLFHYQVIKVNADLDIVSAEDLILDHSHMVYYQGPIKSSRGVGQDPLESDWGIVFAPYKAGGYKKIAPVPNKFLFVRVGRDGKIKEKTTFETKVHTWKVIDIYEKDGAYFLYGPGVAKKVEKTYYKGATPQAVEKGFTNFQLIRLENGSATFVSAPTLDEFAQKTKKPVGQKKPKVYNGKKVDIRGLDISTSGDIFINAQDYSVDAVGDSRGLLYKDLYMFHFSKDGSLKASYGIQSTAKKGGLGGTMQDARRYATGGSIVESADGKKLYWMLFPIKKVQMHKEVHGNYEYTYYTPRMAPRAGSIDLTSGELSEFQEFGGEKFFLFNAHPFVQIEAGSQVLYLGEGGDKGRQIWLGKFSPATL